MRYRVYSHGMVIRNLIVFSVFSLLYIYVNRAYVYGFSPLDDRGMVYFFKSFPLFIFPLTLLAVNVVLMYFLKKISTWIFAIYSLYCLCVGLYFYSYSFDKLILFYNFSYFVSAYLLLIFLRKELDLAWCNPNYTFRDMRSEKTRQLKVFLKSKSGEYEGVITNWDDKSFFVQSSEFGKDRRLAFTVKCFGVDFCGNARVVLSNQDGRGVRVINSKYNNDPSWSDFLEIINDRGHRPLVV